MNKKGQALVEFIIILPLMLMIFLAAFDYVNIINTKISLENELDDVLLDQKENDNLKINIKDDKTYYEISKDVNITSPVLSAFLGSNYEVNVKRVVHE